MYADKLSKWVMNDFKCTINKPIFGLWEKFYHFVSGKQQMVATINSNILVEESLWDEVLC